jgi:hypothetical protein
VSETFTQPLQRTKSAVLAALKRMRIEVSSSDGQRIDGKTKEHPVEVRLTRVTEKATKVTVKIEEGLNKDPPRRRSSSSRRSGRLARAQAESAPLGVVRVWFAIGESRVDASETRDDCRWGNQRQSLVVFGHRLHSIAIRR